METVSGINNWKLVIRREGEEITILRGVTCDAVAALPEELFGLPVTVLGDHALSPTAWPEEGEEVLVTCGRLGPDTEWNNRNLRDLTLPKSLYRIRDYALLNCDGLHTLRLHDSVRYWSGGALMNCRSLSRFYITRIGEEQGETLAFINDELSRELDVTITETDGRVARLLFPEFMEIYEENCAAHHFDYNIQGGGYPYHHCFRHKKLDMKHYDGLWKVYRGMEHESFSAMRLAWWRLRYPVDLSEQAENAYLDHLRQHTAEAICWLLEEKDPDGLRFLLERAEPDKATLTEACAIAREQGAAEALAILLEEEHKRFPSGLNKSFDL